MVGRNTTRLKKNRIYCKILQIQQSIQYSTSNMNQDDETCVLLENSSIYSKTKFNLGIVNVCVGLMYHPDRFIKMNNLT